MIAYKTRVKIADLKKIIKLPSDINSTDVELIILSEKNKRTTVPVKKKKKLGGILNKYSNSLLIDKEKDIAWKKIIEEKHGLL